MVDFQKDTKDSVEKLYGEKILKNYPNYGKFWEEMIGVREINNQLLPKELDFSKCPLTSTDQDNFKKIHEQICMATYAQFCHLSGAHFQLNNITKNSHHCKLGKFLCQRLSHHLGRDVDKRIFLFVEAFEAFYQNLGNVNYQVNHIKNCLMFLQIFNFQKPYKDFISYLDGKETDLGKKWDDLITKIKSIRDYIVHFSRLMYGGAGEKFIVPANIPPFETDSDLLINNLVWSDLKPNHFNGFDAQKIMPAHLKQIEELVNKIQSHFLDEIESYMKKNLIQFK